jgi:ribosomal protein S18 acetylase RimI-like enzyme
MREENGTSIDIRRFQSGDGTRIRKLNETAMATTPEYVPDAPDEDLRDVKQHYLDSGGEFLVGSADDTIIGMGAYSTPNEWKEGYISLHDRTAELTRMRVAPDWQGRGIGSAIYTELEQRARHDGYGRFVLDTGVENNAARGFYEDHGFLLHRKVAVDFEDLTIELALYQKTLES